MCMEKNVGGVDRVIRIIAALVLFGIGLGTGWWILHLLAIIVLLTAIFGWCGLYTLLKINTCKVKTAPAVAEKVVTAVKTAAAKPAKKKAAKKKAGKKKKK